MTEACAHENWQGTKNMLGAGGTMSVLLPFGTRRALRLRLAGRDNDDRIDFRLVLGGYDQATNAHAWHTLSLRVRSHGMASISLVALEFGY